jgi:hypothetical protein
MTPRQLLGLYLDRHRTDPDPAKWSAAIVAMFDEREADVCNHVFVIDEDYVLHECCQLCGVVRNIDAARAKEVSDQ